MNWCNQLRYTRMYRISLFFDSNIYKCLGKCAIIHKMNVHNSKLKLVTVRLRHNETRSMCKIYRVGQI